jgi:hypothetical protein
MDAEWLNVRRVWLKSSGLRKPLKSYFSEALKSEKLFDWPLPGGSQVSNARPGAPLAFPVGVAECTRF